MADPGRTLLERMRRETVFWDGGLGTALLRRGLPPGEPPERWNLDHPDEVRAVHRSFLEAGSDLVQTNSFGGNRVRLALFGLDGDLEEINEAAVGIARSVVPEGKFVVGDLGPTGAANDLTAARIEGIYREQASILESAGVDLLHIETISGRTEALPALRGAKGTVSIPVIVSITLRREGDSFRTLDGDDPAEVWRALEEGGADAVGTNCMLEGPDIVEAVRRYRPAIGVPFVAQPVGSPAFDPRALIDAGADGVGRCCEKGTVTFL